MRHLLIFLMMLPAMLLAQSDCNLEQRYPMPTMHQSVGVKPALTPDKCSAKSKYVGNAVLTCSPPTGEKIVYYGIRIISETIITSDCETTTRELQRDTFVTGEETVIGENRLVGGLYVVQAELLREAPKTRPVGFMATLLPDGQYAGYWVTHYGEYATAQAANAALKSFKAKHPEFCSAFVRRLPTNCRYRFEYR